MALVGCGNIGSGGHLPAYEAVASAELAVVCDVDADALAVAAARSGAEPMADFAAVLERDDVDAVDLCVPTGAHADLAIAALRAGKHVLCEKPIAVSAAEAEAMMAAAEAAERVLMVGQLRRFEPRYRQLKTEIDRGAIGAIRYVRRTERIRLPLPADSWFWNPTEGGGVAADLGVHCADLLRWCLGADPVRVHAVGRAVRPEARAAGSLDFLMATVTFDNGAVGSFEASWAHPAGLGIRYGTLDIVGTEGRIHLGDEDSAPMVHIGAEHADTVRYFPFLSSVPAAFEAEVAEFVRCVRTGDEPEVTAHDATVALRTALAAEESARTGQAVTLEASR